MSETGVDQRSAATILVAEDSPTQAEQLRFHLEQHGFTVVLAGNGREALALARRHRPSLIITDVVMPEVDGYQLCHAVKSDPNLHDIPVVIVTSLTGWDDIARSLECGAENFLRKPYESDTLIARIDSILLNQGLRKRNRVQMGMEIQLGGKRHFVNSDREQILDLLISTYDEALHMNAELQARQEQISHANQVLRSLFHISQQLAQADTHHAACTTLLRDVAGLPGFQPGWIMLRDAKGELELITTEHLSPPVACQQAQECACLMAIDDLRKEDATLLLHCPCRTEAAHHRQVLACTPLHLTGGAAGALVTIPLTPPDRHALDILNTIGRQLAGAIERAALLERLNRHAQDMEKANQELESFSYSVSHDLSSPLRAVDGFSRKLEQRLDQSSDEESLRLLGIIRSSCQKMNALIKGLLEFSRLGRVPLRDVEMDMAAIVSEVLTGLRIDARADLQVTIGPLPCAPGDSILIRQVWENLLSNAIKYSSTSPGPHVEVRGWRDGNQHVYAVKDNGAGFDMRYYDKLFGVFQRLHREDEYPGTGIGLANVKRIVTRHGGNVWADAVPGEGATFYFSLPCEG